MAYMHESLDGRNGRNGLPHEKRSEGGDDAVARQIRWKSLYVQGRLSAQLEEARQRQETFDLAQAWERVIRDFDAMADQDREKLFQDFEGMDRSHSPDD